MSSPAEVKGCGHKFCLACISHWAKVRTRVTCPLCNSEFATLVLGDGKEQEVQCGQLVSEQPAADLMCLDHQYFLQEVNRLLQRANVIQSTLMRDACGRGARQQNASDNLEVLHHVMPVMEQYRRNMEEEVRFNPEAVLSDLYQLQDWLSSLLRDVKATLPELFLSVETVSYTAMGGATGGCYHDDYDDYYDDDDDDDDYHGAYPVGNSWQGGRGGSNNHNNNSRRSGW